MGWEYTKWTRTLRGVGHVAKLVLFVLADQADNTKGLAWPSIANIASDAGLSDRHVITLLGELQRAGVIAKVSRGNSHRSTEYRLNRDVTNVVNRNAGSGTDQDAVPEPQFTPTVRNSQKGQSSIKEMNDGSNETDGARSVRAESVPMQFPEVVPASDDQIDADVELIVNHPAYRRIGDDHKSQLRLHIRGGLQVEVALDALDEAEAVGRVLNHYVLGELSSARGRYLPRGAA